MWGAISDERTAFKFTAATLAIVVTLDPSRGGLMLFQIRNVPNLEDQVPVFTFPKDRMPQIYSQALGSLFVAYYD
jgi:hypothetical protein